MTAAPSAEHDVLLEGLKLHYQEWGDRSRPTVILLHGFGVSGHMFDEFAARAGSAYHLVALDQRGHGDSDWAVDGDYRRGTFATDLEGVRRALGIESFFLVGHGMGGLNAVTYAAHYPARVRGLVLVDMRPETNTDGADDVHRFTHAPDELDFEEFVDRAQRANPRRSLENIRERMRHRLRPIDSGLWTWKFDRRFRHERDSLRMGGQLTADEEWELLRSVKAPVLVVRGADSDVLSQEVAERLAMEIPGARLEVVAGAGHSVPGDNPEAFSAAVVPFLDAIQTGSAARAVDAGPTIDALVRENQAARRRRPGVTTLLLMAAGAALATFGIGWSLKRRSDRKRARQAADVQASSTDTAARQARMAALAAELAGVGRASAVRARALATDPHVQAALAQARAAAGEAGHRSIEAVHHVDTARLRDQGRRAAQRSRRVAAAGARTAAGATRKARARRDMLTRLRSWR